MKNYKVLILIFIEVIENLQNENKTLIQRHNIVNTQTKQSDMIPCVINGWTSDEEDVKPTLLSSLFAYMI